jgi:hypothetical protein
MIYLIITSSINNKAGVIDYEHRKNTYINAITKTLSILPSEIKPIIVENNGTRETYLDSLPCDIHYTSNNSESCTHKGVNELLDIKSVIEHYKIQDDDMIIKLTGRYTVLDDSFFKRILENSEKDAFVKFFNVCTMMFLTNDCVLGLFAIRCKFLKNFAYSTNYANSPEVEFATYVKEVTSSEKRIDIQSLGVRCCFADNLRILDV